MKRTTDPNPPSGADALRTALVADRRSGDGGFSLVPTRVFFKKGMGSPRKELRSYQLALKGDERVLDLRTIEHLPPKCKIIPKDEGVKLIAPGSIAFCVMARLASNELRRLIASSIGCAIPADKGTYGYLSEHHSYGQTDEYAGDFAEDMAASMLASTLGVEFDETANWDEKEQVFKISGEIIRTFNVTQSAVISAKGWTTVLSSAVFLF
jgi:arginine decarboxylase